MPGGLMQLSSFGAQDVYITGDPQVTYFKLVYRRHTPFAMESIEQQPAGIVDFNKTASVTIARNGDLLGKVWLQVTLPDLYSFVYTGTNGTTYSTTAISTTNGFTVATDGTWSDSAKAIVCYLNPADNSYYLTRTGTVGSYAYSNPVFVQVDNGDGTYTPRLEVITNATTGVKTYQNPATWGVRWANSIGHALMRSVEVEIGGQRIDRHVSEWLDAWSELTETEEKRAGLWEMIGKYSDYSTTTYRDQSRSKTYYVPLQFFFCKSPGLSIPIVALQYHDIKLNFDFRDYTELIRTSGFTMRSAMTTSGALPSMDCHIYADFVFLDVEERRRFAQIPHEYLIEQIQFLGDEVVNPSASMNPKINLAFNHPVKELVWLYTRYTVYQVDSSAGNDYFNYDMPSTATSPDFFTTLKIQLNGNDRFSARPPGYFRLVQPYQHHTRCPTKRVYCYSFALHPEDAQPSGTCNFSRIDASTLNLTYAPGIENGRLKVFAVGYNVLRVASGLAGVAFST